MRDVVAELAATAVAVAVGLALWRWAGFPVAAIVLLAAIHARLVVRDG